jgi:hypothetical protein
MNLLPAQAQIAKLSQKAGKTVRPIPTKRYLDTAAGRGKVVKVQLDPGKVRYHLPAKGRK